MRNIWAPVVLVGAVGCSTGTDGTESHRDTDGVAVPEAGAPSTPEAPDAGAKRRVDCRGSGVTNAVESAAPLDSYETAEDAEKRRNWKGGLPTWNPCAGPVPTECTRPPMEAFTCPVILGPGGMPITHVKPGDSIDVRVPVSDAALNSHSCGGIAATPLLAAGGVIYYAVSPAYAGASGMVPLTLKPGDVIHFSAGVSGGGADACLGDFTQFEFDLPVE